MKKIFCNKCNKYLGVIRDGKLHKDIVYLCKKCNEPNETNTFFDKFFRELGGTGV